MRALLIAAGLLFVASPAHAEKKKKTALALTGVGTGVSGGLILASFLVHPQNLEVNKPLLYTGLGTSIVTPSLGHFYAGRSKRALVKPVSTGTSSARTGTHCGFAPLFTRWKYSGSFTSGPFLESVCFTTLRSHR